MAAFLKGVARHWVKVDDPTLEKMKRIASRLALPRRGMTAKNRERLRPLDDTENVAAFLALPQRLRREVESGKRNARSKAMLSQMAAAIALLQAAPIRLKNLTALDVNKNLIARGKRLYLVVAESEVKNNEPIDFELPAETRDILAWYVREHRPFLISTPSDALFPGPRGGAKSSNTLAKQIPQTVLRYTGLEINVHLFRHAAGKLFLDARPGQYEVMRRVLGHRSITTTTSLYAGAETRSAGSHFAAVIAERRRALEQQSKKRGRIRKRWRSEMNGGPYGRGKAPERRCLKVQAWPEDDRRLWEAACRPSDVLDPEPGGLRANHAIMSNRKAEKGYGRWLTFLQIAEPESAC